MTSKSRVRLDRGVVGRSMHEQREWYVVRTKPRREAYAQVQLARRGVETFLPRILESNGVRPAPVVAPLFPSYLFAHISLAAQFNNVIWSPGVRTLVGFGESPTPVDDSVVDFIQTRCGPEGVVRAAPAFQEGEWVRVRRGPLEGLVGVVQGLASGQSRVQVLMEVLRRHTRVSVPVELLERAEGLDATWRVKHLVAREGMFSGHEHGAKYVDG
jgi:transcription elongation factor/antiterminator RfaH